MQPDQRRKSAVDVDFFTEYGEGSRYRIEEVIGKGSYGVVCSAYDTHTGEKVAIKKINDIFEHVSDATRILREIKLLRLLRHPDIVEIKHILLPPSRREFKDIYVVFELMESDLHQVIKANDDLTPEHYQFFLYQLLRGMKYIHTANVFHRDLKPKNILANADCKLKICDFGLARVAFNDTPTAIFWTDYVATRWYRAPELCGSFFSKNYLLTVFNYWPTCLCTGIIVDFDNVKDYKTCFTIPQNHDLNNKCKEHLTWCQLRQLLLKYTPAIDIWSIGCIFAELLTGKPLFPGKNVVHQLDLMTDMLGTPSADAIARVRNEKARRYLCSMRKKKPIPFSHKFPNADPLALRLLERMLAFEPKDRPTAEEALADPYFKGLAKVEREPSAQPVTKMEFEFERRRITKEDVRELIYREILEYHPKMLKEQLEGSEPTGFMYPSAVDHFKKQFAFLEEHYGKGGTVAPLERQHASLPRACVLYSDNSVQNSAEVADDLSKCSIKEVEKPHMDRNSGIPVTRLPIQVPQSIQGVAARPGKVVGSVLRYNNCGAAATAEALEQRRMSRNAAGTTQYTASNGSYPRRNPNCKNERCEDDGVESSNGLQPKPPQYMPRKVAAAQGGAGSLWY
ncbi:mitogen-activated protein kinase 16 [Quercus suber]|uniref:mitogen-activated protein kinase n=1 Tax=Quercus suber TaxID=58331 RepID=A0AAW0L665_QUESU